MHEGGAQSGGAGTRAAPHRGAADHAATLSRLSASAWHSLRQFCQILRCTDQEVSGRPSLIGCGEAGRWCIHADCAPVCDLPQPGAHDIIGDRAHGRSPDAVAQVGRAVADGFLASGVLPVIKHLPGHGRARVDSHLELPVVETPRHELEAIDFLPFRALSDLPWAMTGHVVYTSLDKSRPATTSGKVIEDVIREDFGFEGKVKTKGEIWQARSPRPVQAEQDLKITGIDGLVLLVTPLNTQEEK